MAHCVETSLCVCMCVGACVARKWQIGIPAGKAVRKDFGVGKHGELPDQHHRDDLLLGREEGLESPRVSEDEPPVQHDHPARRRDHPARDSRQEMAGVCGTSRNACPRAEDATRWRVVPIWENKI